MRAVAYGGVMDGRLISGSPGVCNVPTIPMGPRQVYEAHSFVTVQAGKLLKAKAWVLKGGEMPTATTAVTDAMVHGLHEVSDYPMEGRWGEV